MESTLLLTDRQVAEALTISRALVWKLLRSDATFPRPIILGAKSKRWIAAEITTWLSTRKRG
jgi:predicted DNA-binding transcriptional regulator AlpA